MLAPPKGLCGIAAALGLFAVLATPTQAQLGIEVAGHVLRRTSYGPTPGKLISLLDGNPTSQAIKIDQYIDAQLGANIPDPYQALAAAVFLPSNPVQDPTGPNDWDIDNLARYNLSLALYSENQLRELMVGFWQQHFNTSHGAVAFRLRTQQGVAATEAERLAAYFEFAQNDGFRTHALGSFRRLLEVSAEGVAMLIYLDSNSNKKGAPNENYARELMELHTLGTNEDGIADHYTQADVEAGATIFTGWFALPDTNGIWKLQFDGMEHTPGAKQMFETGPGTYAFTAPGDTMDPTEGRLLLDYLAGSQDTADFVCRKLYAFFLSQDTVDETIIDSCKAVWGTEGDIAAVLEVLLKSSRMKSAVDAFDLVERPIEGLTSTVRALGGQIINVDELDFLYNRLKGDLAQTLFRFPSPDGYSFENFDQVSTSQVLYRSQVNTWISSFYVPGTVGPGARVAYDWGNLLTQYSMGVIDPSKEFDVVLWFFLLIHHGLPDPAGPSTEFLDALQFLSTDDNGAPHAIGLAGVWSGPNADPVEYLRRVDGVVRYIASLPRSLQK